MRGNRYARGGSGDPYKSKREKKREKTKKLEKTSRVKRLRSRLTRIHKHRDEKQSTSHMTAIMESYVLRRKKQRQEELKAQQAEKGAPAAPQKGKPTSGGARPTGKAAGKVTPRR
jgi:hypothetical protein